MQRLLFAISFSILAISFWTEAAPAEPIYVDQGPNWTAEARTDFYVRGQGSRLVDLAWLRALKAKDGQPFLVNSMSRYGFLPNPDNAAGLPVGFHTSGQKDSEIVGVTCSACHTRQLEVGGKAYRVDGGPAFTDFQAFLSDLDKAVGNARASEPAFAAFAAAVLQSPTPADVATLRRRVDAWYRRFHAFVAGTLPAVGWGLGRLDAVGIIFNRIAGTDVGPPPDLLIPDNMRIAEAPVRYPFLWNSPVQNLTDWAGFVQNGNRIYALARNTGQALAFANFEPKNLFGPFFNYQNSIDFNGLDQLEERLKQMGPPRWPKEWPIDAALVDQGGKIFAKECKSCHGIDEKHSLLGGTTWETPVQNVGTDTRQFDELGWKVKTGALKGAGIPFIARSLEEEDYAVHMMFSAVAGSILEHVLKLGFADSNFAGAFGTSLTPAAQPAPPPGPSVRPAAPANASTGPQSLTIEKGTMFERTVEKGAYESRVLQGIWAAAPYLHNGSVPTLAELLKPPAQRKASFKVGAKYDIDKIGLAETQDGSVEVRPATDCSDINSGNSRCGHDFGTALDEKDKKALLEYLKTL